jgi:hypothetical protein
MIERGKNEIVPLIIVHPESGHAVPFLYDAKVIHHYFSFLVSFFLLFYSVM